MVCVVFVAFISLSALLLAVSGTANNTNQYALVSSDESAWLWSLPKSNFTEKTEYDNNACGTMFQATGSIASTANATATSTGSSTTTGSTFKPPKVDIAWAPTRNFKFYWIAALSQLYYRYIVDAKPHWKCDSFDNADEMCHIAAMVSVSYEFTRIKTAILETLVVTMH